MPDPALTLDPEVALMIAYAPQRVQPGLRALWTFDARLATILRTTCDPTIGQLRLTWWHDAVGRAGTIAGEPLLAALAEAAIAPDRLQRMVEGWEALLDGADDAVLNTHAEGRGGALFGAAAVLLGADPGAVAETGAGWALVDLARHHSRPDIRARALALAAERLASAPRRWPRPLRSLGALAKLARRDLGGLEVQGSPGRLLALATLAITGR